MKIKSLQSTPVFHALSPAMSTGLSASGGASSQFLSGGVSNGISQYHSDISSLSPDLDFPPGNGINVVQRNAIGVVVKGEGGLPLPPPLPAPPALQNEVFVKFEDAYK